MKPTKAEKLLRAQWEAEQRRIAEILRDLWLAKRRRDGAVCYHLPDANGDPTNQIVALNSMALRRWVSAQFRARYGRDVDGATLRGCLRLMVPISHARPHNSAQASRYTFWTDPEQISERQRAALQLNLEMAREVGVKSYTPRRRHDTRPTSWRNASKTR